MTEFRVELAGIPIGIRCAYGENKTFLREYLTEREPLFFIEPDRNDLLRSQEDYDRQDRADGCEPYRRHDLALENTAIHRLLAEKLTEYGVLLVHGSALCMDGEAYLFTAPSGTGKSTHARFWRETFGDRVFMINDDKPMLRVTEDGVSVYGTPWDGKHDLSRNTSAPLRAIAVVKRAAENRIEPLPKKDAVSALIVQAFSSEDPAVMKRILALEKQILDRVAFYTLSCNTDPDAARVAYEGMRNFDPK